MEEGGPDKLSLGTDDAPPPDADQGDFTVIMKTLQHYPPVDINVILNKAAELCPCKDIPGFSP